MSLDAFFSDVKSGLLSSEDILKSSDELNKKMQNETLTQMSFDRQVEEIKSGNLSADELTNLLLVPHRFILSNVMIQIAKRMIRDERTKENLKYLVKYRKDTHVYHSGITVGHLATATLFLIDESTGKEMFHGIYSEYSDDDKEKTDFALISLKNMAGLSC